MPGHILQNQPHKVRLVPYVLYKLTSIPLKPYFKDFYWSISNIYHGVYLVYTPSHRNVLTLVPLM